MKNSFIPAVILFALFVSGAYSQPIHTMYRITPSGKGKINLMVDNIGYWNRMVKLGYILPDTQFAFTPSRFSAIMPQNSPDIPVTGETDVTQSENSVFIDPEDENFILNSNNSSSWILGYAETPYGADALFSLDSGLDWQGSTDGVNGTNSGDPSTAIGLNGWWYVGRITADYGQAVSYSKNQGKTWTRVKVGQGPTAGYGLLDKNHLWIDNSKTSPFKGNLYDAWTNFIPGSPDTNQIQIVRSSNQGLTWSSPNKISAAALAGKLNHGVNISTAPDGEVYVAWSIYDTWPSDETAIGFTKSIDGGVIFTPATRIISNIKGIRASLTGKNMRVHSFPSMAVDNSTGPNRGTIYIVWPNVGFPGINTGNDIDIYLIRSTDNGATWSSPIRVNQDPPGLGKQHYFPWITCDPVTGGLCVIYYDDRNLTSSEAATFVSYSYDGGMTWSDMQVSDNSFTPEPIAGLAFSYFGDYLGIQSNNMKVYPVWTDNHDAGRAMSYTSPFDLGPNPNQPWVMYYSDSLATVSGTGNVTMNNGDSLWLSLGLKNIGDQPAMGITAIISSASPYILITDSVASYGILEPSQIKVVPDGFTFRVSDTIPDNLMVRFNVKVTGSDSVWHSHFAIESHAPGLHIAGMTIIDTLGGNRNGRMDPGETVKVTALNANYGDFPCNQATGLLATVSPYLILISDSVDLGDILPRQTKDAVFTVAVSSEAPVGAGVDLVYRAQSGLYRETRSFRQIIGMLAEDWETNTFTRFPWQPGGAKPWTLTQQNPWEGIYCARSGTIADYQSSQLFISYTSANSDTISFYVRTSSEQDYDYLMFSIDAVWQGQWSGETPWTRVSFPVNAGTHIFKWIYLKDLSYATGEDAAWVDFIALPAPVLPVIDPGANDTICAGNTVQLHATAQQCDSIKWTTAGDGGFDNDTALITTYLPGIADINSGAVTLLMTGFAQYGSVAKHKYVRINHLPLAQITAFPGDTACAGQAILLKADTSGYLSLLWAPGNYNSPEAVYDTLNAGGMGSHLVMLTVTDRNQCQNRDSVNITFRDCTGLEEYVQPSAMLFPNPNDGRLLVQINNGKNRDISISVTNIAGDRIFNESFSKIPARWTRMIDLSDFPDGMYILNLSDSDGVGSYKFEIRR